jgi:uncharacterized membrane protein
MQGLLTRVGWWFVPSLLSVVALPSTASASHMSEPPEDPLILVVVLVAVLVLMIGVIIAMAHGRSQGRLTKKRGSRRFGKGKGRGAFLR